MYLFEICTGSSLLGVVDECRQYNGPLTPLYFYLFFFLSNLVLLNLFVALLLDNFDLMGSDDFGAARHPFHLRLPPPTLLGVSTGQERGCRQILNSVAHGHRSGFGR